MEKQCIFELHRASSGAATQENRHGTFDEKASCQHHSNHRPRGTGFRPGELLYGLSRWGQHARGHSGKRDHASELHTGRPGRKLSASRIWPMYFPLDRALRPGEPTVLLTTFGAARILVDTMVSGGAFDVHVFNNNQGAMQVTRVGP